ncbi:hypothetical protein KSP39_PZI017120 [Platanthera zijinensis]|uniref:Uncharacterized protein n=1 Tax=Platanthera zijinensis TaxID=2320716 RepID=A0AAP0FZQ9_9ASPA
MWDHCLLFKEIREEVWNKKVKPQIEDVQGMALRRGMTKTLWMGAQKRECDVASLRFEDLSEDESSGSDVDVDKDIKEFIESKLEQISARSFAPGLRSSRPAVMTSKPSRARTLSAGGLAKVSSAKAQREPSRPGFSPKPIRGISVFSEQEKTIKRPIGALWKAGLHLFSNSSAFRRAPSPAIGFGGEALRDLPGFWCGERGSSRCKKILSRVPWQEVKVKDLAQEDHPPREKRRQGRC